MITKKIYIKNTEELNELVKSGEIPEDYKGVIENELSGLIGNRYVCLEISSYFNVRNVEAAKVPIERRRNETVDSSFYV